ncbi:AAA family ATPase [Kribbella sp. WER1]
MKPRLIVLRGNSGSGKSSVVEAIRAHHGHGIAYIEQDYVRRTVFQELAEPDGANIELIGQMARYALASGFHAVVEGILPTERYARMLQQLHRDHGGHFYYLDVPFEETVRRHATRDKATAFTADDMAAWYRSKDLLDEPRETVIDETSSLASTVQQILDETGLGGPAAKLQVGDHNGLTGSE